MMKEGDGMTREEMINAIAEQNERGDGYAQPSSVYVNRVRAFMADKTDAQVLDAYRIRCGA
jgi:hypothetical protein